MGISIIYEDQNLMVINKPSGLITHPKNIDDNQESVTGWLIKNYPELKDVGEPFIASGKEVPRAGVVHRLDKDTSGLLVVAKNNESFFYLKKLFQERKIKKHYLALVEGIPKEKTGTISSPLGRIGLKWTTRLIGPDAKGIEDPRFGPDRFAIGDPRFPKGIGTLNRDKKLIDKKEALTDYKVVETYQSEHKPHSLLEVVPRTGRTHQIRVHLNSIGHPIAGDEIYGFKKSVPPPGLKRLFLHAYKLEFETPDNKNLVLEADLPEELQKALNMLE